MGSPETGKFSTAFMVSAPQSSFGVVATLWSLDGVKPAATPLGRTLSERPPGRLGDVGDEGPADVAARATLAGVEALRALALGGAEGSAPETLDGMLFAHT
jgi:hypothetical protein